jgi:hypothetical protein
VYIISRVVTLGRLFVFRGDETWNLGVKWYVIQLNEGAPFL